MQQVTSLRPAWPSSWLCGLVLVFFPLFSCSGASVTQSVQPEVELSIEPTTTGSSDQVPTITSASVDNTVVSGVISTPNPCYTIDAAIEADGHNLTLTVTARSQPTICVQVLGLFAYEARVTGLAAGSYPIRMVYEYPDTGWERKEHAVQLRIP